MKKNTLSARDAAWLAETLDRRLGKTGLRMELAPAAPPPSDPPADEGEGKGSKNAVLADLAKERKARQALEDQVKELAPLKEQMTALAAAFGVKPEVGAKESDVLATVQEQLAQMQRENAVLALANQHGITDQGDVDLLKSSGLSGDALSAMAARLKPAETKPGTPKPDASQGGTGEAQKVDPGPGLPRLQAAYANSETSKP